MNSMNDAAVGLPFSLNYLRPSAPLNDSSRFRVKISQAFGDIAEDYTFEIKAHFALDVGVSINGSTIYEIKSWFLTASIADVLDCITSTWTFFVKRRNVDIGRRSYPGEMVAEKWHSFVSAAFSTESMGYQLDERCGVHYFVDSEFEGARAAAVSGLGAPRYTNVAHSLEKAYAFLDGPVVDTKSAARSAFEAIEILAKLMVSEAQNLNGRMIETRLEPLVLSGCIDDAHKNMASAIMKSLKEFVNGVHYYRHGQGEESVIEPPMDIAVYILSQVSNAIRLLIPVDQRLQSGN
jgi:hypothetical protein